MFKVFSVLAALVALAPGVQAASLNFFVTINGLEAFSWDQSSAPAPIGYVTGSYTEVPVIDLYGGSYDSVLFNAAPAGMFDVDGYMTGGPQVYSGSEAHPRFAPGVYDGTDAFGDAVSLDVTTVSEGTPEAGTWVVMIIGLGGVGVASRASRRALGEKINAETGKAAFCSRERWRGGV
jgi:hypothetical protein